MTASPGGGTFPTLPQGPRERPQVLKRKGDNVAASGGSRYSVFSFHKRTQECLGLRAT